jgi:hypothetical protein
LERENVVCKYTMDCEFKYRKVQGLFRKSNRGRGIVRFEPLDLKWMSQITCREGRERSRPEQGQARRSTIVGGKNLAGAHESRPTGHGKTNRKHREQEETMVNSPQGLFVDEDETTAA